MRTVVLVNLALLTLALVPASARAIKFSGASIETWSSCDTDCRARKLTYTHNQITYFDKVMRDAGHVRAYKRKDSAVDANQYIEDQYGGQDQSYVDSTTLHAFSGHGDSSGSNFTAPMCNANGLSSCSIDSSKMVLGERSLGFEVPYGGSLRWLMLLTCYSVHTRPNFQWGKTLRNGTEFIMGYKGLSADSSTTDEVAGDWADEAMDDDERFKASWFYAIEDFWGVDDTGGVVGGGQTRAGAIKTRDKMRRSWNRRTTKAWTWAAWSYHRG